MIGSWDIGPVEMPTGEWMGLRPGTATLTVEGPPDSVMKLAQELRDDGRVRFVGSPPIEGRHHTPSVQEMVRDDLIDRERLGQERYGTSLYPHNGRSALQDAYEEALDLACYLRQALAEQAKT